MKLSRVPWIPIAIILIIGLFLWWIYATKMEWYERTVDQPPSNEARKNPLLAATRLLDRYGYTANKVQESRFFDQLESKDDGIVWLVDANVISDKDTYTALSEWTKRGGHLILGLDEPMSELLDEVLLDFELEAYTDTSNIGKSPSWYFHYEASRSNYDRLKGNYERVLENNGHKNVSNELAEGLARQKAELDAEYRRISTPSPHPHKVPPVNAWPTDTASDKGETIRTFKPEANTSQAITVQYSNSAEIFYEKTPVQGMLWPNADKTTGAYVNVQIAYGEGLVTALGDTQMFKFENLNTKDNGAYLLHLLNAHPSSELNYFLNIRKTPTLTKTLWSNFPTLLLLLAVALICWVLFAASRLGPVRTEQTPGRTNLVSHLRARGHFWRRRGDLTPMSEPVRLAAIRSIRHRYTQTETPSDADIPADTIKKIAKDIGCAPSQVQRALSPHPLRARDLPDAAFVLQHILHKTLPRSSRTSEHNT